MDKYQYQVHISISGTNINIEYTCKNMSDGSAATSTDCLDGGGEGNMYQPTPVTDIPDGTVVSDDNGDQFSSGYILSTI